MFSKALRPVLTTLLCLPSAACDSTSSGETGDPGEGTTTREGSDDFDDSEYPGADGGSGPATCEAATWYPDADGDGYGDPGASTEACNAPPDHVDNSADCDDSDPGVHPDATELCDGRDNDCDAEVDDADTDLADPDAATVYRDADGDGFGDTERSRSTCTDVEGYAELPGDCNDTDAAIHPDAVESCDTIDNDCDGQVDDADDDVDLSTESLLYADEDRDGYGAGEGHRACNPPAHHVASNQDCDDDDDGVHPGATEFCDTKDNDCDGTADGTAAEPDRCDAYAGTYAGNFSLTAEERLGVQVINEMTCSGSSTWTLDPTLDPPLQGTATCDTPHNTGLFDDPQSGVWKGQVDIDGNVTLTLEHAFRSDLTRTYDATGTLASGILSVDGDGDVLPHHMSAVPWIVEFSATGM